MTVTEAYCAGGVVGESHSGTLRGATRQATAGTVDATTAYAGGVVGYLNGANLNAALSSTGDTVTSPNGAGGLIGLMANAAQLSGVAAMHNGATFGASTNVGGIVGILEGTSVLSNAALSSTAISA